MVFLFDSICVSLIKYLVCFFFFFLNICNFEGRSEKGPDRCRWYNLQAVLLYKGPESLYLFFFPWQSLMIRKKSAQYLSTFLITIEWSHQAPWSVCKNLFPLSIIRLGFDVRFSVSSLPSSVRPWRIFLHPVTEHSEHLSFQKAVWDCTLPAENPVLSCPLTS